MDRAGRRATRVAMIAVNVMWWVMRASDPRLEERVQTRLEFGTRQLGFFYAVNATVPAFFAAALLWA